MQAGVLVPKGFSSSSEQRHRQPLYAAPEGSLGTGKTGKEAQREPPKPGGRGGGALPRGGGTGPPRPAPSRPPPPAGGGRRRLQTLDGPRQGGESRSGECARGSGRAPCRAVPCPVPCRAPYRTPLAGRRHSALCPGRTAPMAVAGGGRARLASPGREGRGKFGRGAPRSERGRRGASAGSPQRGAGGRVPPSGQGSGGAGGRRGSGRAAAAERHACRPLRSAGASPQTPSPARALRS